MAKQWWTIVNRPWIYLNSKLVVSNSNNIVYVISEEVCATLITVAWKEMQDEKNFYFLPQLKIVIIDESTMPYLSAFPFFQQISSSGGQVLVDLEDIACEKLSDVVGKIVIMLTPKGMDIGSFTALNFGPFLLSTVPALRILKGNKLRGHLNAFRSFADDFFRVNNMIPHEYLITARKENDFDGNRWKVGQRIVYRSSFSCRFAGIAERDLESNFISNLRTRDVREYRFSSQIQKKILILTRRGENTSNRLGTIRWINDKEYASCDWEYSTFTINPGEVGFMASCEYVRNLRPHVIVSAGGSANWGMLCHPLYFFENLIVFGGYNLSTLWTSLMLNYRSIREFIWILYRHDESDPIDEEQFSIPPLIVDLAVRCILSWDRRSVDVISIYGDYILMPPSCSSESS